ncbi:TKL/IRAK protein kinase [Capsaspora owczarzaki ATCC 30864]|uniref:TKL/IRAK protein kinase n=1 Tax=Capsaspora owczarzaki (strain ATCC 30864) TaxID=595528 RepID=A0A0D2WS76_CAPO3|nr:TKL/IRAK protein kinase [Capsaspora owczarzaki ATCC 30864]
MASAWTPRQRELFEKAKSSSRVIFRRSGITHDDALVIAEGLKANGNLQYLELSDNQIGDAGAQAIGSALRNKSTLIALSLNENKISDIGAFAVAEGLQASTALTQLGMSVNQIGDAGARAIGSVLRNKANLARLYLSQNKIGDAGARAIAEGLQTSTALTDLRMFENQIGDDGAQAIGAALRTKANLSLLYLSQNKIGDAGARAIAEGLKTLTVLTDFRMFENQIGDAGAQAIGAALRNKTNLSSLYLSENKIGDIGACAIAEGVQAASALTELGMSTNQIGDAGAQAIGAALRNKANLSKLNLWDNQISSSAVQLLSKSVPAKCEFSAGNQRTRPQNATSPPAIPPKPAHLDHTPNSPLAASDATSQQVRELQARIAQLELAQQTTTAAPILSTIPRVSLQVLSQATTQFSESKRIGGGGFGSVYSGVWSGQRVAVKRLAADSTQGVAQFESELEALSRFRHPNIVTIMCYAQEGNERCLVYELMPNGSVRDRLDRKGGTPALSWQQRRTIATDIANAMHFVQTAIPRQPLFHLDLKTDNVLLAADFHAKVADFGLTRSAPAQVDDHSYIRTQTVQGTLQYICPQYRDEGKVSIKTDVYSYGMILLELVTGHQPSIDLMGTVRRELKKSRKIDAVLDKAIDWSPQDKESAQATAADLASDCLEPTRVDRPSFGEILRRLSGEEVAGANEEETIEGSDRECLVCYNAPTNAKLMPCHHACVCVACAQMMIQRRDKCMICRVLPTSFQQGTYTKTFVH